ncbi:MAG: BCCT family transporter, partial [Oscillospiraceae bacterium]
ISKLATICIVLFFALLALFFFTGPTRYIIESGISGLGGMANNFISLSTWMDPLRLSAADGVNGFPQTWTIFYWAYWISWAVATPFFIGKISEGRTIRQTIIGAYISGLSATFTAFIIFGNYGLYQQMQGKIDPAGIVAAGGKPAEAVMAIFGTLPWPKIGLALLVAAMIAFYASTFDALTLVISAYSVKNIKHNEEPSKKLRIFWSVVFVVLPVVLLFNESTLTMLQTLSICAALPIMVIIGVIIAGFIKDLRNHQKGIIDVVIETVEIEDDVVEVVTIGSGEEK